MDDARLLPRLRLQNSPIVANYQIVKAVNQRELKKLDLDDPTPFKGVIQSNGGDHLALRGIPAIGFGVSGVMSQTHPEQEALRRISQSERMRERTELAA